MSYRSLAQAGYFHTHKAELERQGVNVAEWDKATRGKHLPERAKKSKKKKKTIKTPKSEMVKEHRHLVKVLKNPNKTKLSREARKQESELKGYLKAKGYKYGKGK
jgi:hypothetical protein